MSDFVEDEPSGPPFAGGALLLCLFCLAVCLGLVALQCLAKRRDTADLARLEEAAERRRQDGQGKG